MANDFLVSKWKLWYKSLDVNHDGKISKEDMEESRSKFSELHELPADKKQMVEDNFKTWWDKYVFHGKTGDISDQQFIDTLNCEFKAGKDKFVAKMSECFNMLFDVIDTNKDRSISEDEFLIAFKAYGHENVALDTKFFKAYKPTAGLVPMKDIVNSWVNFTTSEDSSKEDVVKTALESGI